MDEAVPSGSRRLVLGLVLCVCGLSLPARAQLDDPYFAAVVRDDESAVVAHALRGGDLNALRRGEHALLVAAREGSIKVGLFLLSQRNVSVDVPNPQGETPIMLAAIKGHLPLVRRLIERGAAINKPGWTALHYAAAHPEPIAKDIVALLLERHAYIDAESPNGTTPLMMAARYGHRDAFKLLLNEGADAAVRNRAGLAAVDFARTAARDDLVDMLAQQVRKSQPRGTW
jgi:ankyrin repeat protein